MQHSVLQKKLGEKERERARMWKIWYIVLGSWDPMAASYLREKCVDFIWHSRGTGPNEVWDGEWMRVRMSGYMLQNSKTSTSNGWETCRHNFCVIGAVVFSKTTSRYFEKNELDVCLGSPRTSEIPTARDHETKTKHHNSTKCRNQEDKLWTEVTMNHHNPAVLRPERAPPSTRPSLNRPRYQTCVWMDPLHMNGWTQCRGARFISSKDTPPKKAPSSARGGRGRESGRAYRMCERMGGWVMYAWLRAWLAVCETGWELERRRREETKSFNILTRNKIEKRNNVASNKFQESKFCLNRLILISLKKKKKKRTLNMRQNCHWGIIFVLDYC